MNDDEQLSEIRPQDVPAEEKRMRLRTLYDQQLRQEWVRGIIAFTLTGALIVFILAFIIMFALNLANPERLEAIKEFFPIVASVITGLVGAVIGYYFRLSEPS